MPTYGVQDDDALMGHEGEDHVTMSREEYDRLHRLEAEMQELKEMLRMQMQHSQQAQAPPPPPPQPVHTPAPQPQTAPAPDASSVLDDLLRRPRHSLPDVPLYDGKAYNYAQFETKLRAKLSADARAIGSEHNCVLYSYNRLGESAANLMQPWLDSQLVAGVSLNMEGFLEQLRFTFQNQDLKQDALSKLQYMKQGGRTIGQYVAEFNKTLIQAGQSGIDEGAKIQWFKNGINKTIRDKMIGQQVFSFSEYCSRVSQIEFDINDERRRGRGNFGSFSYAPPATHAVRQQPKTESADAMDWEPTANQVSTRRAKWVSKSELERRRAERKCLRCASAQHMIKNCPFAPAIRPTNQPRVQALQLPTDAVLEDTEEELTATEESEN